MLKATDIASRKSLKLKTKALLTLTVLAVLLASFSINGTFLTDLLLTAILPLSPKVIALPT